MDTWQKISQDKRNRLFNEIPKVWRLECIPEGPETINARQYIASILPERVLYITSLNLVELSILLSKGDLSAVEVTTAYCHAAAYSQQILNCCSEIFFQRALNRATELDSFFAAHGKTVGPLHGVPISLKDQFNIDGLETSLGYVAPLGKFKTKAEQSTAVDILLRLGAVLYVKTTVPMACLMANTISNAFGYTYNAINRNVSAGGSSGGSASLVASGASVISLGTDIGGSIRIPAAFQGLYSLKPSDNRFPYQNVDNSHAGQSIMRSVIGPIGGTIEDLEYFCSVFLNVGKPWLYDPNVQPKEWASIDLSEKGLTFGILHSDDSYELHPPVKRALQLVEEALYFSINDIIPWEMKDYDEIMDASKQIYTADGGEEVDRMCKLSGEPKLVELHPGRQKTVPEHWEDGNRRYKLQKRYLDYWNKTADRTISGEPIDALITPVWQSASFLKGEEHKFASYTIMFNMLDLPVVTVPVTVANKSIDTDTCIGYDKDLYNGTPVGIQVVTRRWQEEYCVACARVVRDCLQAYGSSYKEGVIIA